MSRRDALVLAGVVVVVAALWARGLGTWYWIDEGLSVGIASHPLGALRRVLAQDTGAPLYHLVLHGWMRLFGASEVATHSLSLLFAVAVVPAGLWAGWSLFDRRTGWTCAALAAISPFLAIYAVETRMYSLVTLLALLTTATFLHAFGRGRRRLLPAFSILLALTAYTHYWGLFLAVGTAAALPLCWAHTGDRRRLVTDALVAYGAAALLFAPWVPTLLYQRAHSAVAWAQPPTLQRARDDVVGLFGGPAEVVALAVGGGAALLFVLRRPWTRSSVLVGCALVIAAVALGLGLMTARASGQWHARYLGVVLAPLLLIVGMALARGGDLAVAMVAVVAILAGPLNTKQSLDAKSTARRLAEAAGPLLAPQDVVFAPMGEVPLLAHYLPPGVRYATTTGVVKDPRAADWRDALARLRRADPVAAVDRLVHRLPAGGHVLATCPLVEDRELPGLAPFLELEIRRCQEVQRHLVGRPDLRPETSLPDLPGGTPPRRADLLTKRSAPS
ncbi:MAG: glycosyltransferase family 39 protein [Actinomycetota bacterium]|nr:glycosyltransferase family 39 protein [Actinomycetota bacterium]